MAYSDWEFQKEDSGFEAALSLGNPIYGNGSLALGTGSSPTVAGGITGRLASGFSPGFTRGRVRAVFYVDQLPGSFPSNNENHAWGFVCMMNQANIFSTGGKAYYAEFTFSQGRASFVTIGKYDYDAATKSPMVYSRMGGFGESYFNEGNWIGVELEWHYHATLWGGGTYLTLRCGADIAEQIDDPWPYIDPALTDLPLGYNRAQAAHVIDNNSPLTTSVGEGLYFYNGSGGDESKRVLIDEVEVAQFS